MFDLFDPDLDVRISRGNLPHWFQPQVTYFVTFRTEDSLPKSVAEDRHRRRNDWLRRHGIDPTTQAWSRRLEQLSARHQRQFHETFSQEFLDHLDKGYGTCVLTRPELARIVADSLRYFDGDRYHMGDFVVMPNHVHLLVCLIQQTDIERQCYSWKKFTAGKINRVLGRTGRFWQEESFDHLVRSVESYERLRSYIANNGPKAGLREGEFLYYRYGDNR